MRTRLAILLVACLLCSFCAAVDRERNRVRLTLDGEYGFPGHRTYGCDDEVLSTQRHQQIGGRAAVRLDTRRGGILQLDVAGLYGEVVRSDRVQVNHREYFLGVLGAKFGWNFKNAGFDLGGGVVFCDDGDSKLIPRLAVRLGRLDRVWLEAGIGPLEAPFDGRASYVGIGADGGWYRFDVGGALVGRWMLDPEDREIVLGTLDSEFFDAGFYGLFSFEVAPDVWLNLGGLGSSGYSFRLGLGFEL
jgi:hypothetical protein